MPRQKGAYGVLQIIQEGHPEFPLWHSGLKDLVLLKLQRRIWSLNFHTPKVEPLKKSERKMIHAKGKDDVGCWENWNRTTEHLLGPSSFSSMGCLSWEKLPPGGGKYNPWPLPSWPPYGLYSQRKAYSPPAPVKEKKQSWEDLRLAWPSSGAHPGPCHCGQVGRVI